MKKKIVLFVISCILLFLMCSCSSQEENHVPVISETTDAEETPEENIDIKSPELSQIRSICELATLECYYHNVAKSIKEKGTGISHIGEKERVFWIEYSGTAKFGIDASKVKMEVTDTQIEITIPQAKLLGLSDYSFTEDSYISSDDGINKNPISAENQTEAVAAAEADIKQLFANDDTMLIRAQDNAKKLIENYIKQLGEISGVNYQITWYYEENII